MFQLEAAANLPQERTMIPSFSFPDSLSNSGTQPHNGGFAVALLVEPLRYKPEGPEFDSRWGHSKF
jgi:hypothetical protein